MANDDAPVIVFDGVCALCNRSVDFVLRHERAARFRFAAMQSAAGAKLLQAHGLSAQAPASFLLLRQGHALTDSDAVIAVLRELGPTWRALGAVLRVIPRVLRDPLYRWVARHRYRIFGKRETCRVPDSAEAWRFIE